MSASSSLRAGRALAESLMVDRCVVTRRGVQVYSGRCRAQTRTARMTVNQGLERYFWNIDDALVQMPMSAPDMLDGDLIVITASELNPHLVNRTLRVGAFVPEKSHETKRVVICTTLIETYLGDSIVVLRATVTTDAYGNRVTDWADATATTVLARVEPTSSSENQGARERDQVITRYEVWVNPDADVIASDRVQYAGLTLAVDGEPLLVKDSSGTPHHKTFTMTASKG